MDRLGQSLKAGYRSILKQIFIDAPRTSVYQQETFAVSLKAYLLEQASQENLVLRRNVSLSPLERYLTQSFLFWLAVGAPALIALKSYSVIVVAYYGWDALCANEVDHLVGEWTVPHK